MAAHRLAIAKATFAAALLRPDPSSVPKDDVVLFHSLLDAAILKCSPTNIQQCKAWLLRNIIHSVGRTGALAKYFATLSGSLVDSGVEERERARDSTSCKRKRLHLLYILNDLLHHTKYHGEDLRSHTLFSSGIQPQLVELIGLAAGCEVLKNKKLHTRIGVLLDLWDQNGYYPLEYMNKLRDAAKNAANAGDAAQEGQTGDADGAGGVKSKGKSDERDPPYVLPATHGDPSTPYYDLPAGNMIRHIVPGTTLPIDSRAMRALQLEAGPAPHSLVQTVKDFLKDVDRIYNADHDDEGIVADIDEMGQSIRRNPDTGELKADTYYGWSREFCERIKTERIEGPPRHSTSNAKKNNGDPSRSRSCSRSTSPRKRRRSSYDSRSPPRHRSGSSRSRSHSRDDRARYRRRESSRSRSPSQSRSRSPRPRPGDRRYRYASDMPRSRSRSAHRGDKPTSYQNEPWRGPAPAPGQPPVGSIAIIQQQPPPPLMPFQQVQYPPPPPFPQGGFPSPPVPPPNWQGTWPPPPPPIMPNTNFNGQGLPNFPQMPFSQGMPGVMPVSTGQFPQMPGQWNNNNGAQQHPQVQGQWNNSNGFQQQPQNQWNQNGRGGFGARGNNGYNRGQWGRGRGR